MIERLLLIDLGAIQETRAHVQCLALVAIANALESERAAEWAALSAGSVKP